MFTKYPWRTETLEALPTLAVGQADNLKLENRTTRVWLCRCGVEDGMLADNVVSVEKLVDGRWRVVEEYCGDNGVVLP